MKLGLQYRNKELTDIVNELKTEERKVEATERKLLERELGVKSGTRHAPINTPPNNMQSASSPADSTNFMSCPVVLSLQFQQQIQQLSNQIVQMDTSINSRLNQIESLNSSNHSQPNVRPTGLLPKGSLPARNKKYAFKG